LDVFVVALEDMTGDPIDKGQPELSVDRNFLTADTVKPWHVVTVAIDEQICTQASGFGQGRVEGRQDLGVAVAIWFTLVEKEGSNLVDI
jgi:hypothetical protein